VGRGTAKRPQWRRINKKKEEKNEEKKGENGEGCGKCLRDLVNRTPLEGRKRRNA